MNLYSGPDVHLDCSSYTTWMRMPLRVKPEEISTLAISSLMAASASSYSYRHGIHGSVSYTVFVNTSISFGKGGCAGGNFVLDCIQIQN